MVKYTEQVTTSNAGQTKQLVHITPITFADNTKRVLNQVRFETQLLQIPRDRCFPHGRHQNFRTAPPFDEASL